VRKSSFLKEPSLCAAWVISVLLGWLASEKTGAPGANGLLRRR
jgi:hypothetical protein